jgi:4'-phosphopantetheinyl transferase
MHIEPRQVDIQRDANGKPHLAEWQNKNLFQFSDSHSDIYAAFAFCRYSRVGVDIEKRRELPEMMGIVTRHFTPRENSELLSCPEGSRLMLFYRFWTRKEALLKAQGEGLLRELNSVDVSVDGRGPGPWPATVSGCPAGGSFWVADLDGPAGFAAAVAVDGPVESIGVHDSWIRKG